MELKNRILSIFAVFAFCVAATSAWAGQSTLNTDGASVRMPQSGTDTLIIGSGVQSIEISRCFNRLKYLDVVKNVMMPFLC